MAGQILISIIAAGIVIAAEAGCQITTITGERLTPAECELRPSDHPNIQIMPVTTDPRRFWRLTKILLMPSLWWESQGLVAVKAMINGVPVVASDCGALPETLGDGGISLSLPDRLMPTSQILPTAEEVEPWVEAVIRR